MDKIRNLGLKIKENFKNNKVPFLICIVIWIVVVVVTINIYSPVLGKKSTGNEYFAFIESNVYELNENTVIEQTIPTRDETSALAIHFSTYSRKNKGQVYVKVIGKQSNDIYVDKTISVSNIQDNAYCFFELKNELDSNVDSQVVIILSSNSKQGSGVGLHSTSYQMIKDGKFMVNDETINGEDLVVRYLLDSTTGQVFYKSVLIPTLVTFSLLVVVLFIVNNKYEYVFTGLALCFGLVFTFVFTPYSLPDETHHYVLVNQAISNFQNKGIAIDDAYIKLDQFDAHYNKGKAYRKIVQEFNEELTLTGDYYPTSLLPPQGYYAYYIPQIIGISLAKILNMNFYGVFYAGRICNLLFYALCVYITIKKTPIHKVLFGVIACLPIFIQQAASYSYDSFINGLALITIAYFLKWLLEDRKIKKSDYIIIFLTCLGLAPAKYVYGFFALLFWLVPANRYESLKKKKLYTTLLCAPMMYILIPILLPRIISVLISIFKAVVNVIHADELEGVQEVQAYTFNYCLSHPMEVIKIVVVTIRYNVKTWFYGAIGRYLSGMTITLPLRMIHIVLLLVGLSAFVKEDYIPNIVAKGAMFAVCVLMGMFTVGGMLIYWTTTADTYIQGIQGRYFSPMIPYATTIFNNKKFNLPKWVNKYIIFSLIILFFEIIMYVLAVTYIN